jgi:hypothetical protein
MCETATLDRTKITVIGLQKHDINAHLHCLPFTFISIIQAFLIMLDVFSLFL